MLVCFAFNVDSLLFEVNCYTKQIFKVIVNCYVIGSSSDDVSSIIFKQESVLLSTSQVSSDLYGLIVNSSTGFLTSRQSPVLRIMDFFIYITYAVLVSLHLNGLS